MLLHADLKRGDIFAFAGEYNEEPLQGVVVPTQWDLLRSCVSGWRADVVLGKVVCKRSGAVVAVVYEPLHLQRPLDRDGRLSRSEFDAMGGSFVSKRIGRVVTYEFLGRLGASPRPEGPGTRRHRERHVAHVVLDRSDTPKNVEMYCRKCRTGHGITAGAISRLANGIPNAVLRVG